MASEYDPPTSRADLADRARKRQQEANEALDWRSSKDNHVEDFDSNFKRIVNTEKQRRESQVAQGGAKQQLTKQQIDARVKRMDIIQEAVKAGTYYNPSQPWNKQRRWIEDGDSTTK